MNTDRPEHAAGKPSDPTGAPDAWLAAIVGSSEDAIVAKNLEGTIVSWNPAAERIFGYSSEEAVGRPMLMLFPPGMEDEENSILRRIRAGERVAPFVTERVTKDGRRIHVSVSISPIRDPQGRIIGASKIARDITRQIAHEREVARLTRLYKALGEVNQCIARTRTRADLYRGVCSALVDFGEFLIAWIGIHEPATHRIAVTASKGDTTDYLNSISVYADDRPEGRGPTGIAFRENHPFVCNDMQGTPLMLPWKPQFSKRGIRSSAAFPIHLRGVPLGALTVYSGETGFFQKEEVDLLVEAAGDISFALENIEVAEERLRSEASLRDSEERFRQIAENINEVFWIADPTAGQMLYVSPAYQKIWGRPAAELLRSPRPWLDSVHPDDRDHAHRHILTASPAVGHDETYRILRPDGEVRWIRERAFPVHNPQGKAYRFVGTAEDVTTRKVYLERITEQASVIDAAHEAISIRDLGGRITYWNRGAERTFGWFADEVLGRKIGDFFDPDEEDFESATEKTLAGGSWDGEVKSRTKDGRKICIQVHLTLIRDALGRPKSILAISSDITEQKALESQFLRTQRLESIGTLAGGIAHDLNNLLAPIVMGVGLLKTSDLGQSDAEVVRTIEASALKGADLVRQVLSFARGVEGARVPLNVGYSVRDVVGMALGTFPKDIKVSSAVEPNLWVVTADPTQIHQVLMNLCVNARDAMPEGGRLEIRATNIDIDPQYATTMGGVTLGRYVQVDVKDSGCGIPKEILERVFEPFFTTKEPGRGTGLGLSTVVGIVRSHGGFVRVDSEVGRGSTFKVFLPVSDLEGPQAGQQEPPDALDLPRGNGEMILVVDDEEAVLSITRRTLTAFGYEAVGASNGAQAISMYAMNRDRVAAVITDMLMPVMDGNAVINALLHLNPTLPIIAMSGRDVAPAQRPSGGPSKFISKPFSAQTILHALRDALRPVPPLA